MLIGTFRKPGKTGKPGKTMGTDRVVLKYHQVRPHGFPY